MGGIGGLLLIGLVAIYAFIVALLRVAGREDDRLDELLERLKGVEEGGDGGSQNPSG